MGFKVSYSPRAKKEIWEALDYYNASSKTAVRNLRHQLQHAQQILQINPYFQVRYKTIRFLPLPKYPFVLMFTIDERAKKVYVRAFFNTKQSPKKYP